MKIFISSLITGMESFRASAKEAISLLGHEPVMAEDFGARPSSPQVACLDGLRKSGLVILLLGEEYGAKQSSGISATHEEYREAKGTHPVIAFAQQDVNRDQDESDFLKEVQAWEGGLFRGRFNNPETLKKDITKAIHEWLVATAAGPLDVEELRALAVKAVTEERNERDGELGIIISIIGGPVQQIIRPSEIEKPQLAEDLLQAALFGQTKIFTTATGNKNAIERDSLIVQQGKRANLIKLDAQGGIVIRLSLVKDRMAVVIKEDLEGHIVSAFKYASWLLDKIDPTQRLSHVAIATGFSDSGNVMIRSKQEHEASPNSYNITGYGRRDNQPVHLKPAHRTRAALSHDAINFAEDLVTLLKRQATDS